MCFLSARIFELLAFNGKTTLPTTLGFSFLVKPSCARACACSRLIGKKVSEVSNVSVGIWICWAFSLPTLSTGVKSRHFTLKFPQ